MRQARPATVALVVAIVWVGSACADEAPTPAALSRPAVPDRPPMSGVELVRTLGCGNCHAGLPVNDSVAPSLALSTNADVDSVLARLRPTVVPHPDFHFDDREVIALARFLGADPARATVPEFRVAARDHSNLTPQDGQRLYEAMNCASCHAGRGNARQNGPVLAIEGERVRAEWLREFLLTPRAIRPFGVQPGDAGRMPRFALNLAEIDSIASVLVTGSASLPAFSPQTLSAHARERIESLITGRYSCLGCHALDGNGGKVGPDLSAAGYRLNPSYVRAILAQPAHVAPGTIMPVTAAPVEALDEIASALAARTDHAPAPLERAGYLSPLDHAPIDPPENATQANYVSWCGACHGAGRGDGYNAPFLRVQPADHTDARAMSARTDARLFDAIAAGGRFLDRSPEMPAFPQLSLDEIRDLVQYLRALCSCTEPGWASDGTRGGTP